jgi:hypothetical protein
MSDQATEPQTLLTRLAELICEFDTSLINDQAISLKDAQTIGRVLSDFKAIQEIDLTNCYLDQQKSKEIADGLMRAKQLQVIKMAKNQSIGKGADAILYNLAFSPKITYIDLSDDPMSAAWQLAGILPIGELDRFDLLSSQSAEELLAQAYSVATSGIETVRAMLAGNGEPDGFGTSQ